MPRPSRKKNYVIQAHTRIHQNWEIERVYVFLQKAYTITSARESARRRLAKLGAYVGNLEAIHNPTDALLKELHRQDHVRKQQGRFLWLRKKKIIVRRDFRLRIVNGGRTT